MTKTEHISFRFLGNKYNIRISVDLYKKIAVFQSETGATLTQICSFALVRFFETNLVRDKAGKEFIAMIDSKINLKNERTKQKEANHCRYLIRNTQRKLYNLESSSFFSTGHLNMKLANGLIDDAIKLYKLFTKKIRIELKEDMESLEQCRNEDFLEGKVGSLKFLEYSNKK